MPARIEGSAIPYEKLRAPQSAVAGHPGIAYAGTWAGKRVVAFAGRTHLYEGYTAHDVAFFVRLAAAAGARTIVLTNAAGALNTAYRRGDVMLVADHINLTGQSRSPQTRAIRSSIWSMRMRRICVFSRASAQPRRRS